MAEYFAERTCDVCGARVAVKNEQAILCQKCYADMVLELREKLEEKNHADDHD